MSISVFTLLGGTRQRGRLIGFPNERIVSVMLVGEAVALRGEASEPAPCRSDQPDVRDGRLEVDLSGGELGGTSPVNLP